MKEQFKIVFDRWYETILLYAYGKTYEWDSAQEIAQLTFIKLWTHGQEVIARPEPQLWLYRVAGNLAIDRHRGTVKVQKAEEDAAYFAEKTTEIATPTSVDISERVASLPRLCRAVIEMYLTGMETGEIMLALGRSQQNVLNQKARGVKLLREKLLSKQY